MRHHSLRGRSERKEQASERFFHRCEQRDKLLSLRVYMRIHALLNQDAVHSQRGHCVCQILPVLISHRSIRPRDEKRCQLPTIATAKSAAWQLTSRVGTSRLLTKCV